MRYFAKFARVYTHKIFDWVAFAKVKSRKKKINFEVAKDFFPKIKLFRKTYKTIVFLGICAADSNIHYQHVYSQYVPFSLGMIYWTHSPKFIFVKRKTRDTIRKVNFSKVSFDTVSSFKIFKYFFHLIKNL